MEMKWISDCWQMTSWWTAGLQITCFDSALFSNINVCKQFDIMLRSSTIFFHVDWRTVTRRSSYRCCDLWMTFVCFTWPLYTCMYMYMHVCHYLNFTFSLIWMELGMLLYALRLQDQLHGFTVRDRLPDTCRIVFTILLILDQTDNWSSKMGNY